MKLSKFLKDKAISLLIFIFIYFCIILFLASFKVETSLIIIITMLLSVFLVSSLFIEYTKRHRFYRELISNIEALDKSFLVLETLDKPTFYDGLILYQALYQINKSYLENINNLESSVNDFKDYIEMWIHEVKLPLASLTLIAHNNKEKFDKKTLSQIKKIEEYVEQVLFYSRSENAEKDYLINKVNVGKVVSNIALKNKDDLLLNKIDLIVSNVDISLYTDSKWLEFIINQIVNNSIKYQRKNTKSWIKITTEDKENMASIIIEDNGIGINASDLPKVFDKSFTGTNGRKSSQSTGMGLFISKRLCEKLGHKISVESKVNAYTRITIEIAKNKYYDVVK